MRTYSRIAPFVVALSLSLSGCAAFTLEYQNSGGFVDTILDKFWFKADTKQMRVLRSYSLVGSLLRLSNVGRTKAERTVLAAQVLETAQKSASAFSCAYSETCFFFDDQMAELDQSLFKLAVLVLDTKDNEDLASELQGKLLGKIPVLGSTTTALAKILDAGSATAHATAQVVEVGSSLLKIGLAGLNYNRRIGALYRDNLELDMVVTIDALELYCSTPGLRFKDASKAQNLACEVAKDGRDYYKHGAGKLAAYKTYLTNPNAAGGWLPFIIPQKRHFIAVTRLIRGACTELVDKEDGCPGKYFIFGTDKDIGGFGSDYVLDQARKIELDMERSPTDPESKFWSSFREKKIASAQGVKQAKQ